MRRPARVVFGCLRLTVLVLMLTTWQACDRQTMVEQRGEELFEMNCAPCHEASNPQLKKQPPRLEGLFRSKTLPSGARATDGQVRKTIIYGIGTMPAFDQRLSNEDVDDLVKYLHASSARSTKRLHISSSVAELAALQWVPRHKRTRGVRVPYSQYCGE